MGRCGDEYSASGGRRRYGCGQGHDDNDDTVWFVVAAIVIIVARG